MSIPPRIESNKCLKPFSTFGIGGAARYFIAVHSIQEMEALRQYLKGTPLPYWVVGKGSNSLFDDRGFDGLVILNKIHFFHHSEGKIHVGAGYSFSRLGLQMSRQGWSGLEFAAGIPGSVGGAVYMNAGASGQQTADTLFQVDVVDTEGKCVPKTHLTFAYRSSPFQGGEEIIVSAHFQLRRDEQAKGRQQATFTKKMREQPYRAKSAGCVFRNPASGSAGAYIDACGLKGARVGKAEVSSVHGNFIINRGGATAADVLALAHLVQERVFEKTGQKLEMEIAIVPYQIGKR